MELFKLFGTIMVDNEGANESIQQTEGKAEGLGNKLKSGIGTAAKWGAAIAGAGVAAVGGMVALANKTAEQADYIDKLSERTGINREELQRWKYAADQSGADVGKLEVGMKKLSEAMVGATNGSATSREAFEQLGISMNDLKGKSPSEVFEVVMNQLADMPESAERNSLGNKLLGKSYMELLPLLNSGSQGMMELKERANELGLVMSEDAVKANVQFGDTMADIKSSMGAVFMHISNEFLPVLQVLLDFILDHMPQIQSILKVLFDFIGFFSNGILEFVKKIIGAVEYLFSQSTDRGKELSKFLEEGIKWLKKTGDTISEIIKSLWDVIQMIWKRYGNEITFITKSVFDAIRIIIDTTLGVIKGIVNAFSSLMRGDWEGLWNALKDIMKIALEGTAKLLDHLINSLVTVVKGYANHFKNAGKAIFNSLWEGIKSVWSNMSQWVSEKVQWVADKLSFWNKGVKSMNTSSTSTMKSKPQVHGRHANGLSYVPFDGYIAELHRGERVLTATENRELGGSKVVNNFHIESLVVREESDIEKVAEVLKVKQEREQRRKGNDWVFI